MYIGIDDCISKHVVLYHNMYYNIVMYYNMYYDIVMYYNIVMD